jgi:pimeloyl-ACP methyl ester carboxylesterase
LNIIQRAYVHLPAPTQDYLAALLMRSGRIRLVPVFAMWLRMLEYFGGDPEELDRALARAGDLGSSFAASLCTLGDELRNRAEAADARGDRSAAREMYFRASLYYLVADWAVDDTLAHHTEIYARAMPCFDRFRALSERPIEKVALRFRDTVLHAHFRAPAAPGKHAVLVIFQGNDEYKEWMVRVEDAALARNMATLSVDQPGFGESRLTGTTLASSDDMSACNEGIFDFLGSREEVDTGAIGSFGLSLGSLVAFYAAGTEPRYHAAAGLGGPFNLVDVFRRLPAKQRRAIHGWTGTTTPQQIAHFASCFDVPGVLGNVRCPTLVVHGSRDELIPPSDAQALGAAMSGARVEIVEGGDHMCSRTFGHVVLPQMLDWLRQHLASSERTKLSPLRGHSASR